MIFDKTLQFSDAQAVTVSAKSTNAINFNAVGRVYGAAADLSRDVAKSLKIPLLIQVVETFDTAAEDGTLKIDIQLDSTDTFTPDKTITIGTFTEAELVAGFQVPWTLLPQGINLQYAQLYFTVGGAGAFTAGKITAGIVGSVQTNGV
ncbi:Bbp16 family capsid cement protein [Aminobacter ciceronei]|uniref:Uncharacterized protein n=1 Tax=Aminobacter ciceronei TaxID=150723 RepID=A0ABR6C0T4_9HYPH|nr:hypothetical protein [Aminobacter ciceronei]MBA8904869.1 hypothetical protein [Aminobacter ciceronei]MBA9018577.1 hypothetical protein [Aminobacter ciceronei]